MASRRLDALTDDELRARLEIEPGPPCPKCGSVRVVPIIWGLPGDPAYGEASKRGLVRLGGCIVDDDWKDPAWSCRDCEAEFGTVKELLEEKES